MLDKISVWIKQLTSVGLGLIALGVVLQVLFGAVVPFIGLDVMGSVIIRIIPLRQANISFCVIS